MRYLTTQKTESKSTLTTPSEIRSANTEGMQKIQKFCH